MVSTLFSPAGWGSPLGIGLFLVCVGLLMICLGVFILIVAKAQRIQKK